jgi:hypothetical protein
MHRTLACAVVLVLAACHGQPALVADAGTWMYQRPPVPDGAYLFETTEFDVAPSGDTLMCTYIRTPLDRDVTTRELHSYQAPGGHHVILFYQPSVYTGADLGQTRPCNEQDMVNSRLVGGGDESHEQALTLPDGLGLRIPAGSQLMIQSHYIPIYGAPPRVRDAMVMVPAAPGLVTTLVDALAVSDGDMQIPPHALYGQTVEYDLDADTHVAMLLGHMHQWGARLTVDVAPADGTPTRTLYAPMPGRPLMSNPPIDYFTSANALTLHARDRLYLHCDWNNTTDHVLEFPQEMCVALMYYYPARGFLSGGTVIETHGGSRDAGLPSTGGNAGCTTPPAPTDDCVRPCNTGNEEGVGRYCTVHGNECAGNHGAILCTVNIDPTSTPFCTKPCSTDATCGSGAACLLTAQGGGCQPVQCFDNWDAGTGNAADASGDADAGAAD